MSKWTVTWFSWLENTGPHVGATGYGTTEADAIREGLVTTGRWLNGATVAEVFSTILLVLPDSFRQRDGDVGGEGLTAEFDAASITGELFVIFSGTAVDTSEDWLADSLKAIATWNSFSSVCFRFDFDFSDLPADFGTESVLEDVFFQRAATLLTTGLRPDLLVFCGAVALSADFKLEFFPFSARQAEWGDY